MICMLVRARFLAILFIALTIVPIYGAAQTEQPTRSADAAKLLKNDPLHIFSESVQALTATVTKSVVQVLTSGYALSSENQKTDTAYLAPQRGIGAGVILSADGLIVTNAHVVQGARKIRVRLQGLEKQSPAALSEPLGPIEARLVGLDRQTDLAVLKIDMTGLPALQLADSNELKQGQIVFAFGSPLGLENSVTMGVVSSTARQINPDNPSIYIQTDAPINPGNSGGPLVDVDGRVVGINTFILSQSGGTEGHVHRGQIGVFARTISPELAQGLHLPVSHGVLLDDVAPGSPADKAGLKVGDIVTSIGGKPVDNLRQFALDLSTYKIGQKVEVSALRNGQETVLSVPVIERPDDPQRFADLVSGPDNLVPRLGVVAVTVNSDLKELIGDTRLPGGVLVAARTPTSALLGEGPQPGDIIHSINGMPIQEIAQLRQLLRQIKAGDPIVLQVERAGSLSFLVLESE